MNPWLYISLSDYEAHMSSQTVMQLQALNKIFKDTIYEYNPKSICVLGSATGNGFEHLAGKKIQKLIGIDFNPEYISVCKERYENTLPKMELICADVLKLDLPNSSFDLIYGALIFEYVATGELIKKISEWLKPKGVLVCIIQLPSIQSEAVSETPYSALKKLNSIMNLVEVDKLVKTAKKHGLKESKFYKVDLQQGKKFLVGHFHKNRIIAKIL